MSDHSASATETPKRKRNRDEGHVSTRRAWIPQPPPPQSASEPSIQYLLDSSLPKLDLVPGDYPEVIDIFRTMDAYEYVLARHESLAARLGAQMTSPKLVKALDSLFEEGIVTVDQSPNHRPPPSWMEVVAFAKANPDMFTLTRAADGVRCCQFTLRDFQCTIGENDWRLIISGAVDRFWLPPAHGAPEDEAAELATVEILEDRLQALIMNADKVAEKARQLNYRLSGRKAGIKSRIQTPNQTEGAGTPTRPLHPSYDLKEDLLNQYSSPTKNTTFGTSATQSPQLGDASDGPLSSHFVHEVMYARVESLPKGDKILPRCDLCRKRRKTKCVKDATASCEDCAKKHAKCTWHNIAEEEAASLAVSVQQGSVAGVGEQEAVSGPASGQGTPSAAGNYGLAPAGALRPVYHAGLGVLGVNSSSVRRSVGGGSDAGSDRHPLPESESRQAEK
ncbi:hypothetical protein GE09DRAFT_1129503 [Coniochaeta sp. 2T2.1]|nr:hypothetical protein GE09DRAFT_1129503 [Coniochaeta sp. 2T2.1]